MLREEKKNRIIKNAQNWREWGKSGRLKKKKGQWIENNKYIYQSNYSNNCVNYQHSK